MRDEERRARTCRCVRCEGCRGDGLEWRWHIIAYEIVGPCQECDGAGVIEVCDRCQCAREAAYERDLDTDGGV